MDSCFIMYHLHKNSDSLISYLEIFSPVRQMSHLCTAAHKSTFLSKLSMTFQTKSIAESERKEKERKKIILYKIDTP